jgi:hypothetical protein
MKPAYASLSLKGQHPRYGKVVGGFTVIEHSADEEALKHTAQQLSHVLNTLAFAVLNQEDERLAFWLYEHGQLLTAHDSNPAYMCCAVCSVVPPETADAEVLAGRFGVAEQARVLKSWLVRKRGLGFLRESQRLEAIAGVLGLPQRLLAR